MGILTFMEPHSSPLGALIGPARSGTTWAGSIIDTSPDVVYRFEPFHRMSAVNPEFRRWFDRLKNQEVEAADVPRLYEILVRAHPLTDKAPFFPVKSYPLWTFGRELFWPVARLMRPAGRLYGAAYSPRPGPPVVFKEVTFIKPLRNLLERTSVPVIYLLRHPCPTVLSEVRRQSEGRPSVRQRRLRELLLEHGSRLAEQFPDVVAGSDAVSRTALLWRCEIEACVPLVRQSRSGMILTYEQLAGDAHAHLPALFAHLGLQFGDETRQFLDSLYGMKAYGEGGPRRTGWGGKYFSVYRNPLQEKDAWKRRISAEDRRKIESIVQGSGAVEYCAALGQWW
jgi:hypothetical protein